MCVQVVANIVEQEGSGRIAVDADRAPPADSEAPPDAHDELLPARAASSNDLEVKELAYTDQTSLIHSSAYTTPAHNAAAGADLVSSVTSVDDMGPGTAFYTAPTAPDSEQVEEATSNEVNLPAYMCARMHRLDMKS